MSGKKEEEEITVDLDQAMKDGMEKFQGELAEAAGETPPTETKLDETTPPHTEGEPEHPEEKPAEKKADKPEEGEKPSEGEPLKKEPATLPAGKPATDTADKPPEERPATQPADKPPEEKPGGVPDRFKTKQAAEKGYRDLQGEKTRVDLDLKAARQRIVDMEQAEKLKKDEIKALEDYEQFATQKYEEALGKVDDLDPESDDYQGQVSRIWARRDRDIREFEREHKITGEPGAGTPALAEPPKPDDPKQAARDKRDSMAREAGIDPGHKYFRINCMQVPAKDSQGAPLSFEDQVQRAIDETKKDLDLDLKRFQETQKASAEEAARKKQEEDLAMGRGGEKPAVTPEEKDKGKPISLDDAVESAMEERRL